MVVFALWPLQDIGSNGGKPIIIPTLPETLSIGRKVTCELVVAEEFGYVSGKHCCVRRLCGDETDKGCLLEDLSANGTYVNTSKVGKDKSAKIVLGDVISLAKPTRPGGALKFKLQEAPIVAAPTSPPPAAPNHKSSEVTVAPVFGTGPLDNGDVENPPAVTKPLATASLTIAVNPPTAVTGLVDIAAAQAQIQPAVSCAAMDSIATTRCLTKPSALAEALGAESRRGCDVASILQSRLAETEARSAELSAELREERAHCLAAKLTETTEAGVLHEERRSEELAATSFSRRLASECSELKNQLVQKQAETARFERELLPAVEEAVRLEKVHALRLQDELGAERACMEQAEKQAQQLRLECSEAEARVHSSSVQLELHNAEARNALLEEECAEIWRDIDRAKASAANSREKLQGRATLLTTLKGAVKEHTQLLMDRVRDLNTALLDIPGGSSAVEDSQTSRSRSPSRAGNAPGLNVGTSRTRAAKASEIHEGNLLPPDNPEDPTLAYPESAHGLREPRGLGCEHQAVDDNGIALVKRRRLPAEVEHPAANATCGLAVSDRQRSTSPSPTASIGESATKAVVRATITTKLGDFPA